jgi:hypothetical protein
MAICGRGADPAHPTARLKRANGSTNAMTVARATKRMLVSPNLSLVAAIFGVKHKSVLGLLLATTISRHPPKKNIYTSYV